jgi:NADH dehydrogenase
MQVTVFGGTGFVGHSLVAQLVNAGHSVVVPVRDREKAKQLAMQPAVRVEPYNSERDDELARAMAGSDAVINLVGILHERKRGDFERVHVELTKRIVHTYSATGGQRFIQMSALGAGDDAPSSYQRSRAAAEKAVRESSLNWTIFAPSVIFGSGDSFVSMFANVLKLLPPFVPLIIPRAGTQFQPVWVDDVARAMVASVSNASSFGQRYELVGPKRYTLREVVKHAGARLGRKPAVVSTPPPFGFLQALAMEFVPGGPLMSRDNWRSMEIDNVSDAPWPTFALPAPAALETITPTYIGDVPDNYARYRQT